MLCGLRWDVLFNTIWNTTHIRVGDRVTCDALFFFTIYNICFRGENKKNEPAHDKTNKMD